MAAHGRPGKRDRAHARPPLVTATLVFLTLFVGSEQDTAAIGESEVSTPGVLSSATEGLPASVVPAQASRAVTADTNQFLAEALANLRSNDLVRSAFAYREREIRTTYDRNGAVARTHERVFEVYPTANPEHPYRRLVRVNGLAPSDLAARDSEQAARTRKLARVKAERGESINAIRQRWERQEADRERRFFAEVADVFEIRFVGREDIDGRPVRAFDLVPRPDRHPKTWEARSLQKFAGRVWFDEVDREVVRLDLESTDTVSYGLGFVARLNRGTRAVLERRKAHDGTWVPVMTRFSGTGRFLLVKWFAFDQICEYTSYWKPDADRIVGFMER